MEETILNQKWNEFNEKLGSYCVLGNPLKDTILRLIVLSNIKTTKCNLGVEYTCIGLA